MSSRAIKGSEELAKSIRLRRNELNLTIEEAALKADVGTKTWSRYESGNSIRKDKAMGVCKALNWYSLPEDKGARANDTFNLNKYMEHKAWSSYLADVFGKPAAISFVIGSDILLDNLRQDMGELSSMPKGAHLGEINPSWLEPELPQQFLMRYNYDFLYFLQAKVAYFQNIAAMGNKIIAHSVIEELTLYLIMQESQFFMESMGISIESDDMDFYDNWDSWVFDIFDDMDIVTFLYSNQYLDSSHPYHFEHWLDKQFYCK